MQCGNESGPTGSRAAQQRQRPSRWREDGDARVTRLDVIGEIRIGEAEIRHRKPAADDEIRTRRGLTR
ncbi:hypothetical protein DVS77_19340 [Mycolicibacterium moriokaense]|nr:hypothetical protein DVS77_19340 [Mycolicibacterium moriokaense]